MRYPYAPSSRGGFPPPLEGEPTFEAGGVRGWEAGEGGGEGKSFRLGGAMFRAVPRLALSLLRLGASRAHPSPSLPRTLLPGSSSSVRERSSSFALLYRI